MKTLSILALTILLLGLINADSYAGWLVFHKPAYKGKVIDVDTKEPIEGAVVVAVYNKYPIISGPAGGSAKIINVQEALTDKDGMFQIPSYTTTIPPLSREDYTVFIIFKPGYASVSNLNLEDYLSKGTGKEIELPWRYNEEIKFKFMPGVVALPMLKRREERLWAMPGAPTGYRAKDLPLLFKVTNEENRRFGLGEEN